MKCFASVKSSAKARAVIFALCMTLITTAVIAAAIYFFPTHFSIGAGDGYVRYVDTAYGFSAEIPDGMEFDYSEYADRIIISDDDIAFIISREAIGNHDITVIQTENSELNEKYGTYTVLPFYTSKGIFYRVIVCYCADNESIAGIADRLSSSFTVFSPLKQPK